MIDEIEQEQEQIQHSLYLSKQLELEEVVERGTYVILSKCKQISECGDPLDCIVKESVHSHDELHCCTKFCFYLTNEYLISSQLSHPHIVSPYKCLFKYQGGCSAFFPRAECDAFSYLLTNPIDITVVKLYLKSMAQALNYLHNVENIAHNDFKLENVLVFNTDNGKNQMFQLTDFGYSYNMGNKSKNLKSHSKYWSSRNTIFLSPTNCSCIQFKQYRYLKEKEGDMFGLGCTLLMILYRIYPFGNNIPTLNEKIKVCEDISNYGYHYFAKFEPSFEINDHDLRVIHDLIINLLQVDDSDRMTSSQLINHIWIK